jgi:hypothetical protein
MKRCFAALVFLLLAPSLPAQEAPRGPWKATGHKGAVSAGGREAVEAGIALLKAGGNAADAAVATILALSVTDSGAFCFGGEVPVLVYNARRRSVEVLAGQGAAPRLATRDYFAYKGGIPARGIEPAAVPATLDVCLTALERHGTKTFADVVAPTLRLLDQKKKDWHADLARTLRRLVEAEKASSSDRSTPGAATTAACSATPTWPPTSPASRTPRRSSTAATPSASAAPGRRAPACSSRSACWKASTLGRWATTNPMPSTSPSRR